MRRDRAGVVDQGRRLAQLEVPAHAAETDDGDLENISYVGEEDNFRVFGAHDSEDRWRVLLYNEPLPTTQMTGPLGLPVQRLKTSLTAWSET